MELNISDLLDNLWEVPVDIRPHSNASARRIKELTMKKIHESGSAQKKLCGMNFVGRLLVAALIIAALAIPVLAASGIQFTDWLEGIFAPKGPNYDYDNDLRLGSESKNWQVSGWVVEISAENTSKTGLTFVCSEFGHPDKSGTLTTTEGYWLEKWNGSGYTPMEGTAPEGAVLTISEGTTQRWEINWENEYGPLDSGSYRIGKTFTYTAVDGKQEQLPFYAKFRVFTKDMEPLVEKYTQAYEELHSREVCHLSYTTYNPYGDAYSNHFTTEIWRNGSDFLRIVHYYNADGTLKNHGGTLFRDGIGYHLEWKDADVNAQVIQWNNADYVDSDSFDLWYYLMNVSHATLVGACEDGSTISFFEYLPYMDHDYIEKTYTFDDEGRLSGILHTRQKRMEPADSDSILLMTLQVHDTTQAEIAAVIEAQNVSDTPAFSWDEDQALYQNTAITENFVNVQAQAMEDVQSIIARARKEADPTEHPLYRDGYSYNQATVFRDPDAQMWKVQFAHSQDDNFLLIVYLSADGTTKMLVYP